MPLHLDEVHAISLCLHSHSVTPDRFETVRSSVRYIWRKMQYVLTKVWRSRETRCGSERFGFFRLPLTNTDDCGRTSVTWHSRCTYRAQSQSNLVSERLERTLVPKMHSNFLFTSSDSEVTWPWRASLLVLPTLPVKRTSKGKLHRYITEVNPVTRIHIQSSL